MCRVFRNGRMRNGVFAIHNWKSFKGLDVGYDKVKTLLGDMAWKKLLERQSLGLKKYQRKISLATLKQNDPSNSKENGDSS